MKLKHLFSILALAGWLLTSCNGGSETESLQPINDLLRKGKLEDAGKELEAYLERNPTSDTARFYLGKIYREQNKLDEALTAFQLLIEQHPNFHMAYNDVACVYRDKGDFNEATKYFNEAVKRDTLMSIVYSDRARLYIALHDYESARRDLDAAKRIDPNNSRYFLSKGLLQYSKGNFDGALNSFEQAVAQDGGRNPEALLYAGLIESGAGNSFKSIKYFDQVIDMRSIKFRGFAFMNRGIARLNMMDSSIACTDFDSAMTYMPDQAQQYIDLYCQGIERE